MKEKEVTAESQIAKFIAQYGRSLLGAGLVLAVVTAGAIGFRLWQNHQETQAQEELFAVQNKITKITEDLNKKNEEANKALEEKKSKDKNAKKAEIVKTPETLVEQYGGNLDQLEKFIGQHKSRKAGAMAAVQLAGLAVDYKDFPRARRVLELVVQEPGKADLFYGLVRTQLGSVLMDLNLYNEASVQFQQVVDSREQSYFHPQALLRLGACHLEAGDFEKAENVFNKLEADYPNTQAAFEAKNYKRLISLKKGTKTS